MLQQTRDQLISQVETFLKIKVKDVSIPPQGMDSDVFFIKDENGSEYVVKHSKSDHSEEVVYDLLNKSKVGVSTPKYFGSFKFDNKPVVILEKVESSLLDSIPINEMSRYIPSMIDNQKKLHQIKSDKPGLITSTGKESWQELMLFIFIRNPNIDWNAVLKRDLIDENLIKKSIDKIIKKIENNDFINSSYSLLHTDFNQRNLFVDPKSDKLTAIIDWGEAMFGDPIYDFARIRMYIWHFNLGDEVVNNYYRLMNYSPEERKLDDLYWLSRVIEYLAWYSEELNDFNIGRIKLHQDFLRNYKW